MKVALFFFFSSLVWLPHSALADHSLKQTVLRDPQIRGFYHGSLKKYPSCEKLTTEWVSLSQCNRNKSECKFSVDIWCVSQSASDIVEATTIYGTVNRKTVFIESLETSLVAID